jgi:hypothetical protein
MTSVPSERKPLSIKGVTAVQLSIRCPDREQVWADQIVRLKLFGEEYSRKWIYVSPFYKMPNQIISELF